MKFILLLAASFVLFSTLARAAGLPELEKRVNQLETQDALLQKQIDSLQNQILSLQNQIPPDDGTAQALVGTWTGSANSIQFRRAVRPPASPGLPFQFENFFTLSPAGPNGQPTGPSFGFTVVQPQNLLPMTVQVNPEMWLARSDPTVPVTFNIKRVGMALEGTGTATPPPPESSISFNLFGVVLSNNFFLLKLRVPATGNCAANGFMIIQGVGSLNPTTRAGMTFTASAQDGDCSHTILRLGLTKQP